MAICLLDSVIARSEARWQSKKIKDKTFFFILNQPKITELHNA